LKHHYTAIYTIARFTALEALRTRYGWLLLLVLLGSLGLALFSGQIAITESRQIQSVLAAASLRLAMVFLLAIFVITSMQREFCDRTIEWVFSLPLPRATYYLGKLLGYSLVAMLSILPACLLMMVLSSVEQALYWSLSLMLELLIVCAASLVFATGLAQITSAITALLAFYLAGRSIAAFQLIAHGPLAHHEALSQRVFSTLIDGLAYLLPDLDRFSRSDWLVYGHSGWEQIGTQAGQALIYLLLLSAVALFDLYRKNL